MKKTMMVLFCLAALAVTADAATLTLTDTQNFAASGATREFQIAKFDTALGTLNSVTITMSGGTTVTFNYTNFMGVRAAGDLTASIAGSVKLKSDGVDLITTPYSENKVIPVVLLPYETSVTDFTLISATANQTYLADSFDSFVGVGNVPALVVTGATVRSYTGIGSNTASFSTNNSYSATVVYDYTVPEPATMVLLGLGGLLLRKRK